MSKTILLTGSAGFIGSQLVNYLLKYTDYRIIGIDSFRHRGDAERITDSEPDRYKVFCSDLSAPFSKRTVARIVEAADVDDIDVIINMASESHVDRSIEDPAGFIGNNVSLATNVLELARQLLSDRGIFFQISTDEVYGPALEGTKHAEWSTILPSNPYAASKAAQEAIAVSYWRTYDIPLIITNTMNVFGERQDCEKFIPMCISAVNDGRRMSIHGSEKYIGKRHYLYAANFASALVFLIEKHLPVRYADGAGVDRPSRFNIVGEREIDNLALANVIAELVGKPLKYELVDFHAARPGHDRRYALDGEKLAGMGWTAPFPFYESMEKTVKWYLANSSWLF